MINIFEDFNRLSNKNDFKFFVINIPEKRNVNKIYQKRFLNQYSDVEESFFDFRKIDNTFNKEMSNRDIEFISLYDLAENNFDDFYFKTDPHWSPLGVNLSSDYITRELKERKII